jgi:hypothetical protein
MSAFTDSWKILGTSRGGIDGVTCVGWTAKNASRMCQGTAAILWVSATTNTTHKEQHTMISNRIRTTVRAAAGTALVASTLGLSAIGFSSAANAAPTQAGPAPQDVCWYTHHPELGWWYC